MANVENKMLQTQQIFEKLFHILPIGVLIPFLPLHLR